MNKTAYHKKAKKHAIRVATINPWSPETIPIAQENQISANPIFPLHTKKTSVNVKSAKTPANVVEESRCKTICAV